MTDPRLVRPLWRGRMLWAAYRATAPAGLLGADHNQKAPALRRSFGRRVRAVGLLALIVPRWIPSTPATPIPTGGDHPAVAVTLWPEEAAR